MPPTIAIFRFRSLRRDGSALRSVLPESHQSSASAWDAGERGHQTQFQNKDLLYHRLFRRTPKLSHFRGPLQLFRSQSGLSQVISQMIGTTQQKGEAITQRFFQKVFLRHGAVLLQPVRRRETCKSLEQSAVNFSPGLPNQLDRWNSGLRLIGIGNERDIKLRMEPLPNTQQREHRVVSGREMSPQIDQTIFPRCDFLQDFLVAEAGEHFFGPFDVSLP